MELIERTNFTNEHIDEALRTLKGVAVLRRSSQNGTRMYSGEAMGDVARLTPSTKSFRDHGAGYREMDRLLGTFGRAVYENDAIVRADFKYLPQHAAMFKALVEDEPAGVGFSVHIFCDERYIERRGNVQHIGRVDKLASIDLVSSTGSTLALFEAAAFKLTAEDETFIEVEDILEKTYSGKMEIPEATRELIRLGLFAGIEKPRTPAEFNRLVRKHKLTRYVPDRFRENLEEDVPDDVVLDALYAATWPERDPTSRPGRKVETTPTADEQLLIYALRRERA